MTKHPAPGDVTPHTKPRGDHRGAGARALLVRAAQFTTPVLLGIAGLIVLRVTSSGPQRAEPGETPTAVRAIRVSKGRVVPRTSATGVVQSPTAWNAVPQVSGEIAYRSPTAEVGRFVEAGEVLFRIDPEEYEIALRQIRAATAETNARMQSLDAKEASTRTLVNIERESLALLETNYNRVRESSSKGAASPGEVDDARREYLSQLARVSDLESALSGFPSDRAALEATLDVHQADLESALLALGRTELAAPFSGRVAEVMAEAAEFVSVGQKLLTLVDIAQAEIVVNSSPTQLRHVVGAAPGHGPEVGVQAMRALLEERAVTAVVRLPFVEPSVTWPGTIDRVGASLDPATRTLPVYVLVDDPYGRFLPGTRPPLIEEMFCEVELRAEAIEGRSLIPRGAYHDGLVYLIRDSRLVRRPVEEAFRVGDFVAVSGLEAGEVVIVSDPPFVLDGMLLSASLDEMLEERLLTIASGQGRLR